MKGTPRGPVQIIYPRKAKIAAGKGPEALQFATEIADYIHKNVKNMPKLTVFLEEFGDYGTIHWHVDYESLAALEQVNNQLLADADYMALENKSGDFFQEGSAYDKLLLEFP